MKRPSFDDLPLRTDGPRGNAWGLFDDGDTCGMLNLLTPEIIQAAAKEEIQEGYRVSTDLRLDHFSEPCFGRAPFHQSIRHKSPRVINDDTLTLNTQAASQWDGFRHYAYQEEGLFFGGRTQQELVTSEAIGTQAWVEKGGIIGRGVLLDYALWADEKGIAISPFTTSPITASVLQEVAASQGTKIKPGDILLVRTGWIRGFQQITSTERSNLAAIPSPPAIGLESSEATLRWLWDQEFAAVAGDQPSWEAWPCENRYFSLHEWMLAGWGLPIGELFDLEQLSEECKKRKRWSFFFSSMPLNVPGGVASPPNGVVLF